MESQLSETTTARREVYEKYQSLMARDSEIGELQARFKLFDEQYTTDLKRLMAIEESGQYFILLTINKCPLCGATSEHQKTDTECAGNVAAVTTAADAESAKIRLLQKEFRDTVTVPTKEHDSNGVERTRLAKDLRQLQKNIDAALSPEFTQARKTYSISSSNASTVRTALWLYRRVTETKEKISNNGLSQKSVKEAVEEDSAVAQYLPKSTLDEFSALVQSILEAWHFPNPGPTYFDEAKRPRNRRQTARQSRPRALCSHAFRVHDRTTRLLPSERNAASRFCNPRFAMGDDENIAGTDLKERFYEHLLKFVGPQQLFIVENTEAPRRHPEANQPRNLHGKSQRRPLWLIPAASLARATSQELVRQIRS